MRRGEEGQVYPALLLAVIGGFAIAVGFLGLQNLLDQSARENTASDAAALSVGSAFRDDLSGQLSGFSGITDLLSLLQNAGDWPGSDTAASQYAGANGASLHGDVQYQGFDPSDSRWTFQVTTEQNDTVKGGTKPDPPRSTSRVAVTANGLCDGGTGILIGGVCKTPADVIKDCVAPTPSPQPTPEPPPSGSPTPTPTPTPTFSPGQYCGTDLAGLLDWDIKLIK